MLQINFEKRFCKNCAKCDKQIHKYRSESERETEEREETEATIKSSDCIVAVVSGDNGGAADDGTVWLEEACRRVSRRGKQSNQKDSVNAVYWKCHCLLCATIYSVLC